MSQPNVVIIMTDQQRGDFSGAEGFALDTMPFIDSLGAQGARFSRAYTPMPVCVPARCSMFTGRFPKAHRVRENEGTSGLVRPTDLVEVLREQGYSINIAGKNHSYLKADAFDFGTFYHHWGGGRPEHKTPQQQEMERWLGSLELGASLEPAPFPLECQLPYRIVSDAIECLEGCDERPFFLWLSFPEPHNPYQVSEPYFGLFPTDEIPERVAGPKACEAKGDKWQWERDLIERAWPGYDRHWRRVRANYCAMIRLIDDQVRRFHQYLAARALLENTLVIFTSDHGDYACDYGLQRKGVGLSECLVRIPLVFCGPQIVACSRPRDEFVSLVDLMPTLCEALGAEIPYGVQGRSLWPLLTGQTYPKSEFRSIYAELGVGGLHYTRTDPLPFEMPTEGFGFKFGFNELNHVTQSGNLKMVRMGRWKLLFDMMGQGELYDVDSDPGELSNLYHDPGHAQVRLAMVEELLRWLIRTDDDLPVHYLVPKAAQRNWYAQYRDGE